MPSIQRGTASQPVPLIFGMTPLDLNLLGGGSRELGNALGRDYLGITFLDSLPRTSKLMGSRRVWGSAFNALQCLSRGIIRGVYSKGFTRLRASQKYVVEADHLDCVESTRNMSWRPQQ